MHPYATESRIRDLAYIIIAICSVLAAYLVHAYGLDDTLDKVNTLNKNQDNIRWLVNPPITTMGFYWLFFGMFNFWIWRIPIIKKLLVIEDFSGHWSGQIKSSYGTDVSVKNEESQTVSLKPYEVKVCIKQTWTRIMVVLEGKHFRSKSVMAAVDSEVCESAEIRYQFHCTPVGEPDPDKKEHDGTSVLMLKNEGTRKVLEGTYYTAWPRNTYGTVRLEWQGRRKKK